MAIAGLAARSLWNRRGTAALTVFAIAVSVTLLLGVQKMREAARESFANTISGTDLVVGARSGPVNLLLYTVFRIGDATANVSWETYQRVARHPDVAWTIPISLGDSHRGYRVLGTTGAYFEHYRFARTRQIEFAAGKAFDGPHDAVIGSEVAAALGYRLGDELVVGHGLGEVSFAEHDEEPFRVAGILRPTGTPVDRTVHVSLQAIDDIHRSMRDAAQQGPGSLTAFLVGMKSKVNVFQMQRALNEYRAEALLAIIPGVALQQLWGIVGIADRTLMVVAGFVVLAGLLGMLTAILTSLNERRREMAILRSVGARPVHIFTLMVSEAALLALAGVVLGVALTYLALAIAQPLLAAKYGIYVAIEPLSRYDLSLLAAVVLAAVIIGAIPAWRAYRNSLADGLTIRV